MSLYHVMFLLLLAGVLIEYKNKETPKHYFYVCFAVLALMLCMRFGQGTDYFSYNYFYQTMPLTVSELSGYYETNLEMGWRFICMIFKRLGCSYPLFVFLLSVVQMVLFWRFLDRYCTNKMLALFLGYHTLYLTYFFSALRQGLVIALFLGLFLEWLLQRKYVRYTVGVVLCAFVHNVSIIFITPLILELVRLNMKQIVVATITGFVIGFLFSIIDIGNILYQREFTRRISYYLMASDISILALAERLMTYFLVSYILNVYLKVCPSEKSNQLINLFKIYSLGIFLYGLTMWSPLISSRATYGFKVIEIALISSCVVEVKKENVISLMYCVFLCMLLYCKNIGSYIYQGMYVGVSITNYPYVSIFNSEKIVEYRDIGVYAEWIDFVNIGNRE